ncbi:hypothetical protein HDZ31DRAFT_30414 [Schizophyllum fasciatum]
MHRRASSLLCAFALVSSAQTLETTAPFTDPNTGIDFQAFTQSDLGYQFGIALPENITSDFIGQLVVPLNATAGWGGVSFGEHMVGPLLLAAWANAGSLVSSFRQATAYAQPPPYTGSNVSLSPISAGTYINATHASLTFLCAGCVDDELSFAPTDTSTIMAYALSHTSPQSPGSAGANLSFHGAGFGQFTVLLSDAQSPDYEAWAEMAGS